MQAYKSQFINLALEVGALKFGEFELKSGRISPYFFNSGMFASGRAAATMARCYAEAAVSADIEFDLIFGPAYKGIPLAALTAAALASQHDRDVPYCFNRKEAKGHGEGGNIVGAAVSGKVLIVDDVITAGTRSFSLRVVKSPVYYWLSIDRKKARGSYQPCRRLSNSLRFPYAALFSWQTSLHTLQSAVIP